jgi:hypothetical protein
MLSAIKAIGACLIILAAVYGLIAIVLMLLVRIKNFFKILTPQQGRPARGLKGSLRGIAIEARTVLAECRDYLRMRVFYSVHPARIDGAGRAFHNDCPDCQTARLGERGPPGPAFEPSAFHG